MELVDGTEEGTFEGLVEGLDDSLGNALGLEEGYTLRDGLVLGTIDTDGLIETDGTELGAPGSSTGNDSKEKL